MSRFSRPVSPVERVFLALGKIQPPLAATLLIEGEGVLDEASIRSAASQVARAHPEAHAAPQGMLGWMKWVEQPGAIPVRALDGGPFDGASSAHAGFLDTPLDVDAGAPCEVVIVRGSRPRLMVRGHAAAADARGLLTIAESFFAVLRGRHPDPSNSPLSDFDIGTAYPQRELPSLPTANLAPTGRASGAERGHRWARCTVDGASPRLLARTVVAVAAHARRHEAGSVCVQVPFDLRALRPGMRSASSLVGSVNLDVRADLAPEDIENALRDASSSHEACAGFAKLAAVGKVPMTAMEAFLASGSEKVFNEGRFPSSGILSSLGHVDVAAVSGGAFTAERVAFIPPGVPGLPLFVGMVETARGVDIVATAPRRLATEGRLEALLDEVRRALQS